MGCSLGMLICLSDDERAERKATMKTVVQPYDEEVDVTVLEVDMPEPELLEQKTG